MHFLRYVARERTPRVFVFGGLRSDECSRLSTGYECGGTRPGLATGRFERTTRLRTLLIRSRENGQYCAKAAPDGYTLLYTSPAYAINPALYKKLPFAQDDLVPIAIVAAAPLVLAMHPSVPANNARELITLLKANPGKYNYATSGNGSILHMAAALFCEMAAVDVVNVPYRGAAPAMNDVLAGQVNFILDQVSTAATLIDSKKLKAAAVTTLKRSVLLPDVPTMDEVGLKGYEAYTWNIVLAPRGTPKEIINKVAADLNAIVQTPEMKKRFLELGAEVPDPMSPEAIGEFVAKETRKWGDLIAQAKITVD
jgi:tripartite-type tricarboxylate transporter receptor subunit TctC